MVGSHAMHFPCSEPSRRKTAVSASLVHGIVSSLSFWVHCWTDLGHSASDIWNARCQRFTRIRVDTLWSSFAALIDLLSRSLARILCSSRRPPIRSTTLSIQGRDPARATLFPRTGGPNTRFGDNPHLEASTCAGRITAGLDRYRS